MSRVSRVASAALGLLLSLAPHDATGDWVRDQLYVALREGPGVDHVRVKTLSSGDEVRVLTARGEWTKVKTSEGSSGWVPSKYLQPTPPAAQALPQVKRELGKAQQRIAGLEKQLDAQTVALEEHETLRTEVAKLENENAAMAGSSRWRTLAAGGVIVLLGMAIGAFVPRSRPDRPRRLRL